MGDGNLHVNCLFSKEDKKNREKADEAVRLIFELTIFLGGTISGEHGIGITKRPFIGMELDMELLNLMKGIKKVFDPKNILNPGKVFP
jgi:glycolate oxidase